MTPVNFTLARKIALEHYPDKLSLEFDKRRWISLCEKINAKDNDPPYRDEQRAWYDTLRDFLPEIKGLQPTSRLFAKDFMWCSLNPNNPKDIETIKRFLNSGTIEETVNPFIARIIIANKWSGEPNNAKKVLEKMYKIWQKGKKVIFIMTCGGFAQFDWPQKLPIEDIGDNKNPNSKALKILIKEAEKCARSILTKDLIENLRSVADYLTLGIDSGRDKEYLGEDLHIELVCLIDLKKVKFYWTGKSYPTTGQQNKLVRISDLNTHFVRLKGLGKVMILGCHDLNMFNKRSWISTGYWRKKIKINMQRLSEHFKPLLILHHPHTTVKIKTWSNGWGFVKRNLLSVKDYAGSGKYYEYPYSRKRSEYDSLDKVLKATKSNNTNTVDFIVQIRKGNIKCRLYNEILR